MRTSKSVDLTSFRHGTVYGNLLRATLGQLGLHEWYTSYVVERLEIGLFGRPTSAYGPRKFPKKQIHRLSLLPHQAISDVWNFERYTFGSSVFPHV